MASPLKSSLSRGWIHLIVGCILVAPSFYNRDAFDNAMGYVVVGIGLCLIFIGIQRLRAKPEEPSSGAAASDSTEVGTVVNAGGAESTSRTPLSRFFVTLGHLASIATAVGFLYLLLIAPGGSASGVGVALGLLLAGTFYGLARMAKQRTRR
jgi:hypothetical protein